MVKLNTLYFWLTQYAFEFDFIMTLFCLYFIRVSLSVIFAKKAVRK